MNFFLSRKSANISFNDTRVGVVSVRNEMIVLLIVYRVFVRKFNLTDEITLEMSQISKDNTHMLQKNSSRHFVRGVYEFILGKCTQAIEYRFG